ncbi:hypothetical protein GCM10027344_24900 [Spelaeicoccus albus]
MVVDEFDTVRTSRSPDDAQTPLRIDADAVLTTTITDEPLQAISRRDPQSRSLHRPDALDVLLMPDAFGVLAAERSDHNTSI